MSNKNDKNNEYDSSEYNWLVFSSTPETDAKATNDVTFNPSEEDQLQRDAIVRFDEAGIVQEEGTMFAMLPKSDLGFTTDVEKLMGTSFIASHDLPDGVIIHSHPDNDRGDSTRFGKVIMFHPYIFNIKDNEELLWMYNTAIELYNITKSGRITYHRVAEALCWDNVLTGAKELAFDSDLKHPEINAAVKAWFDLPWNVLAYPDGYDRYLMRVAGSGPYAGYLKLPTDTSKQIH